MPLDPVGVVLAVLFEDQSSDYVLRVLQRAGLSIGFDLTTEEAYSHKTRKRAYQRRINTALAKLGENERRRVIDNIVLEVSNTESGVERLNAALQRVGWQFRGDRIQPMPEQPDVLSSQAAPNSDDLQAEVAQKPDGGATPELDHVEPKEKPALSRAEEINQIIADAPPTATIRHNTPENVRWFGRVSAAIERWNPSKAAAAQGYIDQIFSKGPARDAASGFPKLLTLLEQARAELQMEEPPVRERPIAMPSVFIGHGHSLVWLQLKSFLTERLHLHCDEFNAEAVAGVSTTTRLHQLLNQADFAFLVMTAEDEHPDGGVHARENVIHEVGLFQGRLGFERAIILLEEGCAIFSNIHGLSYIPFPKGDLEPAFEKIRLVLERENLISK